MRHERLPSVVYKVFNSWKACNSNVGRVPVRLVSIRFLYECVKVYSSLLLCVQYMQYCQGFHALDGQMMMMIAFITLNQLVEHVYV